MQKTILFIIVFSLFSGSAFASGFGVFTQGASGLGQANAVVAHPVGPSSLYFNPALLNDISGRQIEIGTTGVYADRSIQLDTGGTEDSKNNWNFPSNAYYTHQVNEKLSTGFGLFFPFGLSSEWDEDYAGKYLGTKGEITTLNINPVIAYRVNDKLSVAAGFSLVYLDASLEKKIYQTGAYNLVNQQMIALYGTPLPPQTVTDDINQKFDGEGWGNGFNLGILYKANERISIGATYRSHIDINVQGRATFRDIDPALATFISDTNGDADIRLPAQATAGVAFKIIPKLVVETGIRWEDWSSTEELKIELDSPVLGQTMDSIPRDWKATWSYNIGGHYEVNESFAVNAGYLYGENAVPDSTFEPLVPDSDAHLFTFGVDWTNKAWTVSAAFGYERHDDRHKSNNDVDILGMANGEYQADIYLTGLSVVYSF
ncbi:MAG: outer membrane protein transport protein [Desulfuromonadales bacterium]|nr:outer membrane protein transport protein [Desulfuromonadales bacterium]MBN2792715.1 outer membrane protein transport protein [Desulfuromonadales bacterium]